MLEPQNEMGVVVRFTQWCEAGDWEIVSVRTLFPDAVIHHCAMGGKEYTAEFEFKASGFYAQRHSPRRCDVIICWENDWPKSPITVWSLSDGQFPVIEPISDAAYITFLESQNVRLTRALLMEKGQKNLNAPLYLAGVKKKKKDRALKLLRASVELLGGDQDRIASSRDLGWSGPMWVECKRPVAQYLLAYDGRGGGTYVNPAHYKTAGELLAAVESGAIELG